MLSKNEQNNTSEYDVSREGKITPRQLLEEIQPLLSEYFIGGFELEDGALRLRFFNGQSFKLSVTEAV